MENWGCRCNHHAYFPEWNLRKRSENSADHTSCNVRPVSVLRFRDGDAKRRHHRCQLRRSSALGHLGAHSGPVRSHVSCFDSSKKITNFQYAFFSCFAVPPVLTWLRDWLLRLRPRQLLLESQRFIRATRKISLFTTSHSSACRHHSLLEVI